MWHLFYILENKKTKKVIKMRSTGGTRKQAFREALEFEKESPLEYRIKSLLGFKTA